MILRVIRGRAGPREVESLCETLAARLGPGSGVLGGPTRFHLGTRPAGDELDVAIIAFWPSAEAAAAGDARGTNALALARDVLAMLSAAAFEIDKSILRNSELQPVALRIATGRFSKPGSDIEMQELLRERAPGVGEEMTEAYVGRRIEGRAIEVTFVSLWQRIPEGRDLEAPFWPDIALTYDRFEVEVFTAVPISGGGHVG